MIYSKSKSSILSKSLSFFNLYSKVISVSSFTLPKSLASIVLSPLRFYGSSFLNWRPLCIFTFNKTFVARTGRLKMFEKLSIKSAGFTLCTSPPVNSDTLERVSMLHSSPSILTILTVTPLVLAYYPILS